MDFEKLAKDAIAAKAAQGEVAPPDAALCAVQLISQASRSAAAQEGITAVCRGTMTAMLIHGKDLPQTALEILKSLPSISLLTRVDPEKIMTWVLEGIAEVTPSIAIGDRHAILEKIEGEYMGVGAVFSGLCDKAAKKQLGDA